MAEKDKTPSAGIPPAAIWAVVGVLGGLLVLLVVASRHVHLKKQAGQELEQPREEVQKPRQEGEGRE
jgi:hypothetical protein